MAENSKIEWCDHTFNPWVGCEKISPACASCYAETWAKRAGNPQLWQGARRRTTVENWNKPFKWNDTALATFGRRARVFCASLADVFDNVIDPQWREDLFALIRNTPNLDWLLLTKRIGNAEKMLPADWGAGYPNVWLGNTVANQEEADRDIPKLLRTPARARFLSCEPLLGPINLSHAGALTDIWWDTTKPGGRAPVGKGVDWVIAGGESGGGARPAHPDWFRTLRDECARARVPFLFKQWGEWAPGECSKGPPTRTEQTAMWWAGQWNFGRLTPRQSEEMHTDDAPDLYRMGKASTGRWLDGRTWDQFPEVA